MADKKQICGRCKTEIDPWHYETESSFWGWFEKVVKVTTKTERWVRIRAQYFRHNPGYRSGELQGAPMLTTDETQHLCTSCWDKFIGRFMQGRSVDALPGKEKM